ncbi:MAG: hypothetical protein VW988_04515 [Gammaproteobacteria bacterium]
MRVLHIIILAFLLISCSSKKDSKYDELLCVFQTSTSENIDFSIKFNDKDVEIKSWWIDRGHKNLIIDYHEGENDIFRKYEIKENIKIFDKSNNKKAFIKINRKTLEGTISDESIIRSKLKCNVDPKATYKMSLKIAIGKKNYEAYRKQKGY